MGRNPGGKIRGRCLTISSLALARGAFMMLLAVVTWLTLTPNPDDTKAGFAVTRWLAEIFLGNPGLSDKVAHFSAYGALGASAFGARLSPFGAQVWTPVILAAYGASLEILQGLGGVRSPEIADGIANMLGAVAGFGVALFVARLLGKVRT